MSPAASAAMIGMARQDRAGAIELLKQHDTHKLMRPGRGTKSQHASRPSAQALGDAVGAADHEAHGGSVFLTAFFQQVGQPSAIDVLAALIKHNNDSAVGENISNRNRLFGAPPLRIARPAFADLDNLDLA